MMVSASFPKIIGASLPGKRLTSSKAREILHHGTVRGHKITRKQRGRFDAVASGHSFKNPSRSRHTVGIDSHVDYVR